MKRLSERDIENQIRDYLSLRWIVLKTDAGLVARGTKRPGGRMPVGTPDLIVLGRGLGWAIEVKRPDGKLAARQFGEMLRYEQNGVPAFVCRSLDDAMAAETEVLNGH